MIHFLLSALKDLIIIGQFSFFKNYNFSCQEIKFINSRAQTQLIPLTIKILMSSEQDNNQVQSQPSQESQPQMEYGGSDDEKRENDGDDSSSDKNSDRNGEKPDGEDGIQVYDDDYQQIQEEIPEWRKKWEFNKSRMPAPIQRRKLEDDQRLTNPVITKHEYAKIIGLRAKQIYCGSALYHLPPQKILKQPNMIKIAQLQLKHKAIPFIIQRMYSNGEYELWKAQQLQK